MNYINKIAVTCCLSDINSEEGEKTLVELREKFGEDKVAFIRSRLAPPLLSLKKYY